MDAQDDDDEWTLPPEDYVALDLLPSPGPACVRAVTNAGHCVIIDSGADISCIPETFQLCGRAARARPLQVQDAQGGAMQVQAERLVDFVLHGGQQPVVIRERCIVANVTQPLLSLGRLMRKGWWPVRQGQGDNAGLGARARVGGRVGRGSAAVMAMRFSCPGRGSFEPSSSQGRVLSQPEKLKPDPPVVSKPVRDPKGLLGLRTRVLSPGLLRIPCGEARRRSSCLRGPRYYSRGLEPPATLFRTSTSQDFVLSRSTTERPICFKRLRWFDSRFGGCRP